MKWLSKVLEAVLFAVLVSIPSYSCATDLKTETSAEELLFMQIPSVIGVSKVSENLNEVPMSVYVVTQDELQRWGVRNLYEIFQRVPGFSFYNTDYYGQYGPMGRGEQSIWRYGVSIELMDIVDFGHLVISPAWFKNIEVARGPAGLMWGSEAEAGLINFNLRDDLEGTEVKAEAGNYDRQSLDFMFGHTDPNNKKNTMFFGYHEESQDPQIYKNALVGMGKDSNDWKSNGINPSHSFIGKVQQGNLKAIFFEDHDAFVAPVLWTGPSGAQGIAMQNALTAMNGTNFGDEMEITSYRIEYNVPLGNDAYSLNLYNNSYQKQWQLQSVAVDTQKKNTLGFNSSAQLYDGKLDVNFGGDLWGEDQTTAPSMTSNWADVNYGINWYDTNLSPTKDQYSNLYLQGKYAFSDKFKALLGVRTDYDRNDTQQQNIVSGPRIGLFYTPDSALTLKYLYNNTARRPQANEAGSGVSPERLAAHELIGIYDKKDLRLDITVFSQGLNNEITRNNNTTLLNSFYNTSGFTTNGIEWGAKYSVVKDALVYWNGSYDQSKVTSSYINGVEVDDPHNTDGEPLLVPEFTSIIGGEVGVLNGLMKVNLDLRSIMNIPYQTLAGGYDKKSAEFVELTINFKKFWNDRLKISVSFLNLLDNEDPLPAEGEHIGNAPGLIPPEGMRYYVSASLSF